MTIGGRVRSPPTRRRKQQSEMKRSRGGRAGKLSGEDGRKEKTVETERSVGHRWKTRARNASHVSFFYFAREAESGRIGGARERDRGERDKSPRRCAMPVARSRPCIASAYICRPPVGDEADDGMATRSPSLGNEIHSNANRSERANERERKRERDREKQTEVCGPVRRATLTSAWLLCRRRSVEATRRRFCLPLLSFSLLRDERCCPKAIHAAFVNSRGFPGRLTTTTTATTTTTTGRG